MRISDWSSDVCSSDLAGGKSEWMKMVLANNEACRPEDIAEGVMALIEDDSLAGGDWVAVRRLNGKVEYQWGHADTVRTEEHKSELQSLMRISYAVLSLKKKTNNLTHSSEQRTNSPHRDS